MSPLAIDSRPNVYETRSELLWSGRSVSLFKEGSSDFNGLTNLVIMLFLVALASTATITAGVVSGSWATLAMVGGVSAVALFAISYWQGI